MTQKELTEKLAAASDAYYSGKTPLMSDIEFDRLSAELKKMEEESGKVYDGSPTVSVGAKVDSLKKVRHEQPALSLDKVKYKDREDLRKWCGEKDVVISWKMDGLTVVLTYDGGKLTRAATRGDGTEGSDITHNAVYFDGVPGFIPYDGHLVVRGEAVMLYEEFERVNRESGGIYENPRNLAAATIQMLDPEESRKRKITFFAFTLVTPDAFSSGHLEGRTGDLYNPGNEYSRMQWLFDIGFNTVDMESLYDGNRISAGNIVEAVDGFKSRVDRLQYPTDGLVISYLDAQHAASLGMTEHHPRGSIALKWTDETVTTTIRDIDWSVGKTGIITPVAVFDPVRLGAGSTVTRASLHNLSIMERMPVTGSDIFEPVEIGAKAEVYLANMIIPQIASIKNGKETKRIEIPRKCPVCGGETYIGVSKSGVKVLKCCNVRCSARQIGMLMNTFSKSGLFVKGLGEAQLEDLLNHGLVDRYPASFFRLQEMTEKNPEYREKKRKLLACDGWGEKSWNNLLDAIDAAKKTTLQKFLYSLNVPLLGNDLSKKLTKLFDGDIEKFLRFAEYPDMVWLMNQDGIGLEKADNIYQWCIHVHGDVKEWMMLNALVEALHFEAPAAAAEATLSGMTFVITGAVHTFKNRDEFKASVEARGGKVAGSVSRNTDYLVNNDVESTSGKNKKAKELGIPIISEEKFIEMFGK